MLYLALRPLSLPRTTPNLGFFYANGIALIGSMMFGLFQETVRWQIFGFYFWLYAGISSGYLYWSKENPHEAPSLLPQSFQA